MKMETVIDKAPAITRQEIIVNPLTGKEYLVIYTKKPDKSNKCEPPK